MTQSTNTSNTTTTTTVPSPPYRVIALDLDGTLLNNQHQLSPNTIQGLQALHHQHGLLRMIICTGRAISTVTPHIRALAIPQIYAVCSNGTTAFDCRLVKNHNDQKEEQEDNKKESNHDPTCTTTASTSILDGVQVTPLFTIKVPEPIVRTTIQLALQYNQVSQYYLDDGNIYAHPVTETHHALTTRYKKLTGSQTIYITPPSSVTTENQDNNNHHHTTWMETQLLARGLPTKQLVLFETAEQEVTMNRFTKAFQAPHLLSEQGHAATLVRGTGSNSTEGSWFLEVLPPAVHKGTGLQRLATDVLKVPLSKVVAFGDGDNDVEFLRLAGYAVAMKNGRDVVHQVAQQITQYTNDEDGVIRTLQDMHAQGLLDTTTEATVTVP